MRVSRCPLCEHGVLSEVQNGFMRYSVCDGCDSEIANDEQITWNKQNAILNDEKLLWYCGRQEDEDCVNFDLDRMKEAISGPSLTLPNNLTREEMRWYICNASIGSREGLFTAPGGLSMEELTVFAKEMYDKFRGNDD